MSKLYGRDDAITSMALASGITKEAARKALDGLIDGITGTLKQGGGVQFKEFCSMSVHTVRARVGRNPRTGAPLTVPERRKVKFVLSKSIQL